MKKGHIHSSKTAVSGIIRSTFPVRIKGLLVNHIRNVHLQGALTIFTDNSRVVVVNCSLNVQRNSHATIGEIEFVIPL